MAITINLRYKGQNGSALRFAEEMLKSGTVDRIRAEKGNLRYEYYRSLDDPETILLIDSWEDQQALDIHHASPMMATIAALREKYDLHMTVERYVSADAPESETDLSDNRITVTYLLSYELRTDRKKSMRGDLPKQQY